VRRVSSRDVTDFFCDKYSSGLGVVLWLRVFVL